MIRALGLAALVVLAPLAAPVAAQASEGGKEASKGKIDIQYFDLATVALPIVSKGQVVNYVFAAIRVNLTPKADVNKAREKEPFIRDALIRAATVRPFILPGDLNHIDRPAMFATLRPIAERLIGPGQVAGLTVTKELPRRRLGPPQVSAPGAAPTLAREDFD